MPEQSQNSAAAADATPAPEPPQPGLEQAEVLNGGVEISISKIDGSIETVKVRQLPIALLGQWGMSQNDEAFIVELLCNKLDRSTQHNLGNARLAEGRLHVLILSANADQVELIAKKLQSLRTEIEALEAKPRWSDELTDESVAQIRELGERLNKKKFVAQLERTTSAAKRILQTMPAEYRQQSSLSSLLESAASPSAT